MRLIGPSLRIMTVSTLAVEELGWKLGIYRQLDQLQGGFLTLQNVGLQ
jgi:hypothetical protein